MYFWKTNRLVEALNNESLSERDFKNYYLATSIITLVATFLLKVQPSLNMLASIVETLGSAAITIFGINVAFKANGGATGTRFVAKITAICFPLLIKAVVGALALGLCVTLWFNNYGILPDQQEWGNTTVSLVVQAGFFWRLFIHIGKTNG